MTKKDYEKIAEVFKDSIPIGTENAYFDQWRFTLLAMADMLANDNPRFDRTLFLEACGL